jgi:DNA ligase D-like protein (predicted ligase)
MLATLVEKPFSHKGWIFEPKLDGERCLVYGGNNRVEMYSRNHRLLNSKYPELVEALMAQDLPLYIIDGEIVTFEEGITSFAKLQQRMQVTTPSPELRKKIPVRFYAFDLLYLDDTDLRQIPLRYRKELLQNTITFRKPLHLLEQRETEGEAFYQEACHNNWEGIIAKDAEGIYVSDRSRLWLKFKCVNQQEFVIGGYTDPEGKRIGFGALLVGYHEGGKLRYAGKVGTGYSDDTLRRVGAQLEKLRAESSPFGEKGLPRRAHWVKPTLVAEVGFSEWTGDGKLRHPRFLGLRDDKPPAQVRREK